MYLWSIWRNYLKVYLYVQFNKTKQQTEQKKTHKKQANKQINKKPNPSSKTLECQWPCSQETKVRMPEYRDEDTSYRKRLI